MGEANAQQKNVDCMYLLEKKLCRAIANGKEGANVKLGVTYDETIFFPQPHFRGKMGALAEDNEGAILRKKFCTNELKNYCCYLCNSREACEIGCTFLDKPEDVSKSRIGKEIGKTQRTIEELAVFLAKGKISEESYLNSVRTLEKRIQSLKAAKQSPQAYGEERRRIDEVEDSYSEKPTSLWYLAPFFFGILGGLVGYIGTENRDKDMANSLLVFGMLWTFALAFFAFITLSSI